jgi:hypothetical protein
MLARKSALRVVIGRATATLLGVVGYLAIVTRDVTG